MARTTSSGAFKEALDISGSGFLAVDRRAAKTKTKKTKQGAARSGAHTGEINTEAAIKARGAWGDLGMG